MSDKMKQTITAMPEFSAGEQPPASKLTALSTQTKRAVSKLEKAVGDLHDQNWPYSAESDTRLVQRWGKEVYSGIDLSNQDRFLGIANLARLIGPSANLNPKMLGKNTITEVLPSSTALGDNIYETSLKYVPVNPTPSGPDATTFSDHGGVFNSYASSETAIGISGDYHVTSTGKIYTTHPIEGGTVSYTVDPAYFGGGLNYSGATFNVIPDPNQEQSGDYELVITGPDSNNEYTCTLPKVNAQQSNMNLDDSELSSSDANYDKQLELPLVLTQNLVPGDIIPSGFLYLRDNTSGEVYTDATYVYLNKSSIKIKNANINIGNEHCIVTVGTDITSSIDDLRNKIYHSHDRKFGEPFVDLESIVGFHKYEGYSGSFMVSENKSNFAPQYLHRDGWRAGVDQGVNTENAMRGDLVMSYIAGDGGTLPGDLADTYSLYFGRPSSNSRRSRIYQAAYPSSPGVAYLMLEGQDGIILGEDSGTGELRCNLPARFTKDVTLSGQINPTGSPIKLGGGLHSSIGPSAQVACRPFSIELSASNWSAGAGYIDTGLDPAQYKIMSFSMLIQEGPSTWRSPDHEGLWGSGAGSLQAFEYYLDTSTNYIHLENSLFATPPLARLEIWFTDV